MKKSFKSYVIISCLNLLVLLAYPVKAMTDLSLEDSAKSTLHNPKLNRYIIGAGAAYAAGIVALNQIWYKDHERESFHFFNDTKEWKQMDKLGHFYSTYQISQLGTNALLSANVDKDKAYKWGGMIGFFALLPIEVMDGYSSEYGPRFFLISMPSGLFEPLWRSATRWNTTSRIRISGIAMTCSAKKRFSVMSEIAKSPRIHSASGSPIFGMAPNSEMITCAPQ